MVELKKNYTIPLSVPNLSGNEWKYIKDCLDTNWVSSVGSYVTRFETELANYTGAKYAVATSNGTAALHISLIMAGITKDDYVLLPNVTFVAPANVVAYTGASPVFIDIDPHTWQMDLDLLEDFLKKKTHLSPEGCFYNNKRIKAIIPVHVFGNMCNMERLIQICDHYKILVIEDATEALGSTFKGQHAGTFGLLGCFSFNGNKIITTGGGGMIVTSDESLAKRAKHLTTQAKSSPEEYIHDEIGYNYRLVNILAAMGVAQLEQLPLFLKRKKKIATYYNHNFKDIDKITLQKIPKDVLPNNWLYTILLPQPNKLHTFLKKHQIETRLLWRPMNQLPMFKQCLYVSKSNLSANLYAYALSIPCSTQLSDAEMRHVNDKIRAFFNS